MSAAIDGDTTGAQRVPPTPTTVASDSTPNEDTIGNSTDTTRRRTFNPNRMTAGTSNAFKGETSKLNGNVFQFHSVRTNMSQFMETVEALRVYSSSAYKSDIESLTVLFTDM